jgi:hypothetical protein
MTFLRGGTTVCCGTEGGLCAMVRRDWDRWGPRDEELAQVVPKEGGVFGRKDLLVIKQGLELDS